MNHKGNSGMGGIPGGHRPKTYGPCKVQPAPRSVDATTGTPSPGPLGAPKKVPMPSAPKSGGRRY